MIEVVSREEYLKQRTNYTGRIMTSDDVWIDVVGYPKEVDIFGITYLSFEVVKKYANDWNPFRDYEDSEAFEERLKKQTWSIDTRQMAVRVDTIKKYEINGDS